MSFKFHRGMKKVYLNIQIQSIWYRMDIFKFIISSLTSIIGIYKTDGLSEVTAERLRESYDINVVGPMMVTQVRTSKSRS